MTGMLLSISMRPLFDGATRDIADRLMTFREARDLIAKK